METEEIKKKLLELYKLRERQGLVESSYLQLTLQIFELELLLLKEIKPKVPEFLSNLDWGLLREQKKTLLGVIDNLEKNKVPVTDHLNGILFTIDAMQDYAADTLGIPEYEVFDFEVEEKRDETTKYVCKECGSSNVEKKAWVNPNNDNCFIDYISNDEDDCWCHDCDGHQELKPVDKD